MHTNTFASRVLALAVTAGLSVTNLDEDLETTRTVRVYLHGPHWESTFGIVYIGRKSGKLLRGWLQHGNEGAKHQLGSATAVRAALRALAAQPGLSAGA
ncbi:hypothetical protein ACVDFE_00110 [Lentzea chajnantorensis]